MSSIVLNKLTFSNMFSYGKNNVVDLSNNRITQLTAPNGSGKSSIAMIIQETLFNKNIKGIKKTDILNRWSKEKSWSTSLTFTKDDTNYQVDVVRSGAQTKVKLIENGTDISDHKVLDTYKKIADIVGTDFEVFSHLTYQSSTDLLEFLKATDANRKKFLINLFNLEKYIAIGDRVKTKSTETDREYNRLQGELKTIEEFLALTKIPTKQTEVELPSIDQTLQQRIGILQQDLDNYNETCKKIDRNNMYIEERDQLSFDAGMQAPKEFEFWDEYQTLKQDLAMSLKTQGILKDDISKIKVNDTCPSCGQTIDNSHLEKVKSELKDKFDHETTMYKEGLLKASKWSDEIKKIEEEKTVYNDNKRKIERFEHLTQLIDSSLSTAYPNIGDINNQIDSL